MVSHFYGLTNQEVALRREMLGLTGRKGRGNPPEKPARSKVEFSR